MKSQEDLFVEDLRPYKCESKWPETYSDNITHFLADHQDRLDAIEIMFE